MFALKSGIAMYPGVIPEGTISDVLFNGTGMLPTLCNLTDAPVPDDRAIDGVDAFNAFLQKEVNLDLPSIWFYPNHEDTYFRMPQIALRKDNCTLIGWLPAKPDSLNLMTWMVTSDPSEFELYDMDLDPFQMKYNSDQEPERVSTLGKEMVALKREMRDEGVACNNNSSYLKTE